MAQSIDRTASGPRHERWVKDIVATMQAHIEFNEQLSPRQVAQLKQERASLMVKLDQLSRTNVPYQLFLSTGFRDVRARLRVANYLGDVVMEETVGQLRGQRRSVEQAVPGILKRVTRNVALSQVLRSGNVRMVDFLKHAADAVGLLPAMFTFAPALEARLDGAAERIRLLLVVLDNEVEAQRRPLRSAVNKAILELRDELEKSMGRLRTDFTVAFIDSLYPELPKKSAKAGAGVVEEEAEEEEDSGEEEDDAEAVA